MDEEPLLRVLRGAPADEELAALVSVVASRSTRTDSRSAQAGVSDWAASGRPEARPSSWRTSGLPR